MMTREAIATETGECIRKAAYAEEPFDPDASLVAQLLVLPLDDDVSLDSLRHWLDQTYGVRIDPSEWHAFLEAHRCDEQRCDEQPLQRETEADFRIEPFPVSEAAPPAGASTVTLHDIADFVLARAPSISLEPVEIAGTCCAKAGVFLGLQEIAALVDPSVERFAPSCDIFARLRGPDLQRFWALARLLTGAPLPELVNRVAVWSGLAFRFVSLRGCLASLAAAIEGWPMPGNAAVILIVGCIVSFWTALLVAIGLNSCLTPRYDPPPVHLRTFRDLAEHLSASIA